MGIFTQLDVVNDQLGLLGEASVNSLDGEHPLISKGLSYLRVANAREQGRGWWFNTERVTLAPTADGEIIIPADTLQVDPTDTSLQYAQRGRKLYNLVANGGSPYVFTSSVEIMLVRLLTFEDLPTQCQILVSTAAQLDFLRALDGDDSKIKLVLAQMRDALVTLTAEHIRAKDVNMLNNPSFLATYASLRGPYGTSLRHR